ncbi:26S proteasome regulatory subunit 7 [Diaphorina citri]|uniref:26S proteasome regulatory subunit 7 n=1 Tax=Diaphorina citri TaxID=121845 RepID=A0A1S3D1X5_DIACI|nr:26S proteasome regulatory subunit 7 [Diaphorina citri]
MPDYLGDDMRKAKKEDPEEEKKEIKSLDEADIALLKSYGQGQYTKSIKAVEDDIQAVIKRVNELTGIKESDTGLAPPALWDLTADKQTLQNEQPLQEKTEAEVQITDDKFDTNEAKCKPSTDRNNELNHGDHLCILASSSGFLGRTSGSGSTMSSSDINSCRKIHIPLPPKIDPTVTMMQVEEKPDVTYSDIGGCKEQIEKLREVVETPLLHLDGFDPRGNIKVLMATNRPDTLDPALMRPGRLDRKVEFGLPDLEGRTHIFKIHARSMSVERDIRFELLARLCPNSTGAEIRSVCTEAGMFAIRARRKVASEKDFLEAVNKVIKSYAKFSATPRYMTYN